MRRLVDAMAAQLCGEKWERVVAPSLAARRTFAAAKTKGLRCVLVEDMPDLRCLAADLDSASSAHASAGFLQRFRPPAGWVARQEVERVLADEIWVRGHHAWNQRIADGVPAHKLRRLEESRDRVDVPKRVSGTRVRLAGLAAARNGALEALRMVEEMPDIRLLVHVSEGAEKALTNHPRVAEDDGASVDVVVAPAWCECYPRAVGAAIAAGIPVVGTARAAGFSRVREIAPGDAAALTRAVRDLLSAAS